MGEMTFLGIWTGAPEAEGRKKPRRLAACIWNEQEGQAKELIRAGIGAYTPLPAVSKKIPGPILAEAVELFSDWKARPEAPRRRAPNVRSM